MKKKYLKIVIACFTISIFAFLGYKIVIKISHKKEIAEYIKKLPEFQYQTVDGKIFTNKSLKENTPTIFLYFNSNCDFCNLEAEQIKQDINKLQRVQLIFISFEKPMLIKTFSKKYRLDHYDNVTFIHDSKVNFATTFDVKSVPAIIIYNKEKKLVEKIKGQARVDNILKKLHL